MATGQGFCAQVIMIRRRDSENKGEKEKIKKYKFQGQSARSRRWFDIYHDWLEEIIRTPEPDFYKICMKTN